MDLVFLYLYNLGVRLEVRSYENGEDGLPQMFDNLNPASDGSLNLAGLLLFGKNPMKYTPLSQVIAVSFVGDDIAGNEYRDSENMEGNLSKLFTDGLVFMKRNLRKIQNGQGGNASGLPPKSTTTKPKGGNSPSMN